jgi:hypothetical protein
LIQLNTGSYGLLTPPHIREGVIPRIIGPSQRPYSELELNSKEAIVEYSDTAIFHIADGQNIIYHYINNELSCNDYLHSFVTGLILLQRGNLLLHGNSCIWQGHHIAFCGESGTGKSSLAAQFHQSGALFFCDEIICFNKNSTQTLPGYPFLRLWKNDLNFNQFEPSLISKLWDKEEKYKLDTQNQLFCKDRKLDFLIYLETDETIPSTHIEELKGLDKVETFWRSYYHRLVIETMDLIDQFNKQSLDILKGVRVYKLSRPRSAESRLECFDLIKQALKKQVY